MIRFFTEPGNIGNGIIKLSAEDTGHIRSLRLRPEELFTVCDGEGTDYICRLDKQKSSSDTQSVTNAQSAGGAQNTINAQDEQSVARIVRKQESRNEPSVKCTVYIAYAKGDRLDYAVQKSVELGAVEIVLYKSERCVVRPGNVTAKTERLQKIALEAAKQSGRGVIPRVSAVEDFSDAVNFASTRFDMAVLCYEDEKNLHIMTVLDHYFPFTTLLKKPMDKVKSIAIITGPEGGYELSEVKLAQSCDISIVTLGPRILRSETAPVVALSAIMYHTGNL